MIKLDNIDRAILAELVDDSKFSVKKLADRLKVHPNTILQRAKRLENNRVVLRHTAIIDYSKLGYDLEALIFINVKMDTDWDTKLTGIARLPQVVLYLGLMGEYDAMALVRVKDRDELSEVLRKIETTGAVVKSTTYTVLYRRKQPYEFNPLKEKTK